MRPPSNTIAAPLFPLRLPWINSDPVQIERQTGHPVLIEFWDFCRPNSMRTLPYMRAWHERYAAEGLLVIGVHSSGFPPSADPDAVAAAVDRLEIPYPVVADVNMEIWQLYGNLGWPARYLFNAQTALDDYHYGEGAYEETELAIQQLLGVDPPPLDPLRPEDAPDAVLAAQSEDVAGPYSGPYEAGGVWAVLEGEGVVIANDHRVTVAHPGAYELLSHPRSTAGELELTVSEGVTCFATCFTPGLG
jgi:thiol-disulfide isomerase/thioredoxin